MRKLPILLLIFSPGVLLADVVSLRGGGSITGEIVERTDTEVTVDIGAGRMTVKMSSVERITEGPSALSEYRQRAAGLGGDDVESWRSLGRWASEQGLGAQAQEAYERVLASDPDDAEANEATGRVFYDGRWMSEAESYRARGFIEFEGEWMTPQDQRLILDRRRAREEEERREIAAQIRAEDEARAAKEAERAAATEEFWAGSQVRSGGLVYWDRGVGPTVWPDQPALRSGSR